MFVLIIESPAIRFADEAVPAFFSQLHAEILKEQNTIYEELFDIGFETRSQVEEYLQKYCFDPDSLGRKVGNLSGGELQRVLLALALEPLPNILILDEPLSGVDVEGMETLMEMLDEIRKTYDLSILMITHDISMLNRYADQVVLMDRKLICKGPANDVLNSEDFRRVFYRKGGTE